MTMMLLEVEISSIPARAVLHEMRDARDGRGARARFSADGAVGLALLQLARDLQPLTPGLQFHQSADVPQEFGHFFLTLACNKRPAELAEPRVLAPRAFGVRPSCHSGTVEVHGRCVNVLSHWYMRLACKLYIVLTISLHPIIYA